jgi:hypothetical protein
MIALLASDVVLLLTMLVGLLRLRKDGTLFGLGKLLWKQAGGTHSPSLIVYIFRKGLVWLFLATVAEVPPVVSLIIPLFL